MHKRLYFLAGALALIALSIFAYKAAMLDFPLRPDRETSAWELEVRVTFQASGEPVRLSLRLPNGGNGYAVADEQFVSGNYGTNTRTKAGNRAVVWSARHPNGEQFLYYRARARSTASIQPPRERTPAALGAPAFEGARLAAVTEPGQFRRQTLADDGRGAGGGRGQRTYSARTPSEPGSLCRAAALARSVRRRHLARF